ncbi:hypothetical protein PHYSODRAFT_326952 [Phytophthora sojae]|uniref:Uncharacterized protein n=1 Tax=Phytophthora sojae (strain P6497) TaxID=1094619 RepID=G4YUT0_PHYSP|nr:hypothetical protein PHYSODRAFT_326952 [Phytophthora sojae]EGZ26005.1 hypothetical protein PHYSODRAFT_326952 [Phytophthora sojae]|eukprot:XP_009521293.1 hypothetical protein PHYSODRAFT_326952 [Phytophthora sojae]
MHYAKRGNDGGLIEELDEVIANLDPDEDGHFTLLLGHNYTEKSIVDLGFRAFKGIDRARVGVLEGANTALPTDKQLKLYIAKLSHDISYDSRSHVDGHVNSIGWYSMAGDALGSTRSSSATLNFLNPSRETLFELWMPHGIYKSGGYMGNEGPTESRVYSTYAIIAWPSSVHTEKTLELMPEDIAVELLRAQNSTDAALLREFLEDLDERLQAPRKMSDSNQVSVRFCLVLCELLVATGDAELASLFFTQFFPALDGLEDNESLIQPIISIVRTFGWGDISQGILKSLRRVNYREAAGVPSLDMALGVAAGLEDGEAKRALLKIAVEKAAQCDHENFCLGGPVELLWENAIRCQDQSLFESVVNLFKPTDPGFLEYITTAISQCIRTMDPTSDRYPVLASMVSKRVEWLKSQVEALDKPFSWEMSDAEFKDNAKVQAFLRGPDVSMKMTKSVHKFKGLQDAQNCAANWVRNSQKNASFEMEASSTKGKVIVTITKARTWYTECQQKLKSNKAELSRLLKHGNAAEGGGDTVNSKRAPVE